MALTDQLPTTLQAELDIQHLIAETGGAHDADLLAEFVATVLRTRDLDRGDLKLMHRAVRELRYALSVFGRYRHLRKVTVFGSARTKPTAPAYLLATTFAQRIVEAGFMVITGAGDGIMRAAQEGAGRDHSFGLNILLPFEQSANDIIVNDPKLVYFKYFFTRKLIFVKEAHAFALFPGGFGTHDEAFEALTLIQTGKTSMMPVVLVDTPGGSYWHDWQAFVQRHLLDEGLISPSDMNLLKITDDVDTAVAEIATFYRNYHSSRYVHGQLMLRLQHMPSAALLERLNQEFGDLLTQGEIVAVPPPRDPADEAPHLPCLFLWFNRINYGRLRQMIDVINQAPL